MNCFPQPPDSDDNDEDESPHKTAHEILIRPNEILREPGSSSKITDTATRAAEQRCLQLEAENRKLRAQVKEAQEEVFRWRAITTHLFNSILLSPENCAYLKKITTEQMTASLRKVDHAVQFVDCSFPASPSNAPELHLLGRSDDENSQWQFHWDPNWSVQALCSSTKAGVGYSVLIRVSDFEIKGSLNLNLAKDMSEVTFQFESPPYVSMELDSMVKVGPQIPMPLRALIDRTVREVCNAWINKNLVSPQSMTVKLMDKMGKKNSGGTLSDEDLKAAMLAAVEGERRSKNL